MPAPDRVPPAEPGPPAGVPIQPSRTIHARLLTLFVVSATAFALLLVALERSQRDQVDLLFRERVAETGHVLERLVALRAQGAAVHAEDYSRWDEFVDFVRRPDAEWARVNLDESIGTFDVDAAWVLDPRLRPVYTANPGGVPDLARPPVAPDALAAALRRHPREHFYARTPSGVVEIWVSAIRPSDDFDYGRPPSGYYLVARRWTPQRLAALAQIASGHVSLSAPGAPTSAQPTSARTGRIRIREPLAGLGGQPVAELCFETTYPVAARVLQALEAVLVAMLVGMAGLLVLSWVALTRWVRRPLARIAAALRDADPDRLGDTPRRGDEMGDVARLVAEFFVQRRALTEAREAAERAVAAKSLFLANISHELRTPMHGILSFSRFGRRDVGTAPREELADNFRNIEECGGNLLALLNDLLDLSKFEAGRMTMAIGEISLAEIAGDAGDEFASLFAERGLTLQIDAADGLPPVQADRVRVQQVFRNLLSNAAKFTPAGGRVRVRIESADRAQRVLVSDSGQGIPEDELEAIFDKFVQARGTSPRTGGTGLGLAICREIVEAHEGRIWAENRPEGGARVVFELPVAGPSADVSGHGDPAGPSARPPVGADGREDRAA